MIPKSSIVKRINFCGDFLSFRSLCNAKANPKICIVGAGPAGFYAAQHLVKKLPQAQVDIYEKLPVPFGLVRFGVAPDHPEVKNVIHTFSKTAEHKGIRFLGNVSIGVDVSINDLQNAYHAVLLSYGADENRKLNIPGEGLTNVIAARKIVGWYNGIPEDKNLKIDLSGETAAIIGQGNVAIDVARVLLTPVDDLKSTDITQHALDHLAQSKVKRVFLIGRRGPLQAAFTIKELREMIKLNKCSTKWSENDFEGLSDIVNDLPRPKKRITELMLTSLQSMNDQKSANQSDKEFIVKFRRSPLEFIGSLKVEQLKLCVNNLRGHDYKSQLAIQTSETETIPCDLGITSIGYKSIQVDSSIPFDEGKGKVKNDNFKINDGFYASGWVATGPTGVILTTMSNAFATADLILHDFNRGLLQETKPGFELVERQLKEKGVQVVSWSDWLKIDKREQELGKLAGKPREKILDVAEMLQIAAS